MSLKNRPVALASAAVVAGLVGASAAPAAATPASDDQVWSEIDLDAHLSERILLTAAVVDRQGEGPPNPTLWGGGLTADFRLSPNWSIGGAAYEVQVRAPPSGARLNATLPLAYVTGDLSVSGVHISDRNRLEDVISVPGDPWRYRNRLTLEHPLQSILPVRSIFISDEIFYEFSRQRLSRNRAQIGVTLAPLGPADFLLYLMRQDDAFAWPGGLNILGVSLKIAAN
jgi:hypothetical protein